MNEGRKSDLGSTEVAHSTESTITSWKEHERESRALLAWREDETELLEKPTLSGIIEKELAGAGYEGETSYNQRDGITELWGQAAEDAANISNYAVEGADDGAQDNELSAESIRYVANNGFGKNGVADALSRRLL